MCEHTFQLVYLFVEAYLKPVAAAPVVVLVEAYLKPVAADRETAVFPATCLCFLYWAQ